MPSLLNKLKRITEHVDEFAKRIGWSLRQEIAELVYGEHDLGIGYLSIDASDVIDGMLKKRLESHLRLQMGIQWLDERPELMSIEPAVLTVSGTENAFIDQFSQYTGISPEDIMLQRQETITPEESHEDALDLTANLLTVRATPSAIKAASKKTTLGPNNELRKLINHHTKAMHVYAELALQRIGFFCYNDSAEPTFHLQLPKLLEDDTHIEEAFENLLIQVNNHNTNLNDTYASNQISHRFLKVIKARGLTQHTGKEFKTLDDSDFLQMEGLVTTVEGKEKDFIENLSSSLGIETNNIVLKKKHTIQPRKEIGGLNLTQNKLYIKTSINLVKELSEREGPKKGSITTENLIKHHVSTLGKAANFVLKGLAFISINKEGDLEISIKEDLVKKARNKRPDAFPNAKPEEHGVSPNNEKEQDL